MYFYGIVSYRSRNQLTSKMKKYLLLIAVLMYLNGFSQTKSAIVKLDENTIVKDDSGTVLPFAIWKKLMETGDFSVRPAEKGSTAFVVYKLSPEEKLASEARRKSWAAKQPQPQQSDAFIAGEKFKGEKLTAMDGNKFDLKNSTDKIYVINFWFINCPPCRKEIPELNQLVAKYKDNKAVVFIAIALDDRTDLEAFLKTMPFQYHIVDNGRYYASKYGVKGYPTHVIVGKDGLIKFSTLGLAANTVYWIEKTLDEQVQVQ
jgi:thiol-disulfide isomerase/thioredoxin